MPPFSPLDDGDYDEIACEECRSGGREGECDHGYHIFCLKPIRLYVPNGSCSSCICQKMLKHRSKKRRHSGLVMAKKKRRLLPFNPSDDEKKRLEHKASLATGLSSTGTKFSDELTHARGMAPRSANRSVLGSGGMQALSKEDAEALQQCKDMMKRGECPPLMVVSYPHEGFTVQTDRFIKELTIVTEYVGDVDYLKNREHDDGDSMMTLISAQDPSTSLVICANERVNIARYISGINNLTPYGKKKQN